MHVMYIFNISNILSAAEGDQDAAGVIYLSEMPVLIQICQRSLVDKIG